MPSSVAVPRTVPPSLKVTDPVGMPPVPVTAAVNVTAAPAADGLAEDVRPVVLALWTMICARDDDVLAATFKSPG